MSEKPSDPPWANPTESVAASPKPAADANEDQKRASDALEDEKRTAEAPKKTKKKPKPKTDYTAEVVQALLDGDREGSVAVWLEKKGLGPPAIEETMARARAAIRAQADEQAEEEQAALEQAAGAERRKHLLYGALWFGGGAVLTIATYSAASDAGGGRYVLAWGPMIYGAYRLLKALGRAHLAAPRAAG